ncbi:hypothetical protein PIB30_073358 [Stylosanthes scabra]|uniref:Uncharacterized protein n=1 Tax=Stylosanthes scabra TaxID=79078 RepID=A0ABU6URS4_9FABA|nr:hypothetical protein [Stylosanthes scabra]
MEILRLRVAVESVSDAFRVLGKEGVAGNGRDRVALAQLECVFDGFGPACKVNDPMVGKRDDVDPTAGE